MGDLFDASKVKFIGDPGRVQAFHEGIQRIAREVNAQYRTLRVGRLTITWRKRRK